MLRIICVMITLRLVIQILSVYETMLLSLPHIFENGLSAENP